MLRERNVGKHTYQLILSHVFIFRVAHFHDSKPDQGGIGAMATLSRLEYTTIQIPERHTCIAGLRILF